MIAFDDLISSKNVSIMFQSRTYLLPICEKKNARGKRKFIYVKIKIMELQGKGVEVVRPTFPVIPNPM